jgi:hypothetical protein
MPHQGYFVIADITGYTAFLTGSELDHAQDILKSLFDTLLDAIKPPLIISNFQGDAILTYAPDGSFILGQTLLESVENIYCAFAQKLELMHHNTTCTCKACANIPNLDLKLFVHFGEYIMQDMRGKAELSGPDVIIAHRMMKNDVKEKTGLKAYSLFTESAINALGLQDFSCEMEPHSESYDHIGEVKMFAYCLKTMWEREREKRRDVIAPEACWFAVEAEFPAPPHMIWDYFNEPEKRRRLLGVEGVTLSSDKHGRMGVGSIHHCAHGKESTTDFLIVDWKPFEHMTEMLAGMPMKLAGKCTTRLSPTESGTRVACIYDHFHSSSALFEMIFRIISPVFKTVLQKDSARMFNVLREMLAEDSPAPVLS